MASTDTRSGFRLPWSSDRSQEDTPVQDVASDATESAARPARTGTGWPESDFSSHAVFGTPRQRPADDAGVSEGPAPTASASEPPAAPAPVPTVSAAEPPAAAPRKPSKLMADLAAAIRATAETARDQRLSQLQVESDGVVDQIRAQSTEGAVAIRRKSDEDVAAIRDWAKAEIARIKEESEGRIADRKHLLEREVAAHAAAIEDRCAEVASTVAGYRHAMDAYFERLQAEEDPARLATMAEAMPEPPALEALAAIDAAQPEAAVGAAQTEAAMDAAQIDAAVAARLAAVVGPDAVAEPEPAAGLADDVVDAPGAAVSSGAAVQATAAVDEATPEAIVEAALVEASALDDWDRAGVEPAESADGPRWAAGDTPEGFPEPVEGGDPVDRGAIMAALEAAAEAVVAAEAAAESAVTAEAAADVAETAAELVAGRSGTRDEADPEAQAALAARVDAGGFATESYQDRLASLLPVHPEASTDGGPRTTQVVVSGLVSVASIASFKRHLGRLAGVTAVAVASGPDNEFIFNVTHRPDVSFRDAIPTLPGFAARVVATGDGVVSVTAHDPEAEG